MLGKEQNNPTMDGLQVGFHPLAGLQNPHKARLRVILYLNVMPGHFSILCRATYPFASVTEGFAAALCSAAAVTEPQ